MAEQIERFSHALEDYYTEPKAIKDGSCRCHSKMVAAPRSGEWVRFTDHEKAVAAAVEERDRQWREQLEELADRIEDPRGRVPSLLSEPARLLRSLLSPDGKENPGLPDGGSVQ